MGDDRDLIDRLRSGNEAAFAELVERYHLRLVGLARQFVATREAAEDVAQETWLAVVRGVDRFEGRSSLRTWLFQVCVNRARTRWRPRPTTPARGLGRARSGPEPVRSPWRLDRSSAALV